MDTLFSEITYWLAFLFFNFSLFAFNYFINIKESSFLPFKTILQAGNRGVFMSTNPDFFRFSIDLSILMLLVRYNFLSESLLILTIYFSFILVFNIYHYAFSKIYQVNPIIINDIRLLRNAVGFLWAESKFKFVCQLTAGILVIFFISIAFNTFLHHSVYLPTNYLTHWISSSLLLVFPIALTRKGYHHQNETDYRYLINLLRILRHIIESRKLIRKKLNLEVLEKTRNFDLKLKSKPNIYIILIESYGSILIRNKQLKNPFLSRLSQFTEELGTKDWVCKSNLSTSPTLIGPSWLAYTTILFGKKITSNFEYEYIINEERLYKFDTFLKVFQKNGYHSYNLNASKPQAGISVPFGQMEEFYGIDEWILNENIPYNGTRYGFTEGPPDHYVLNYAFENYLKNQSKPYILFYLTKNSHSPFISPRDLPSNWTNWDNTENRLIGNRFLQKPTFEDYNQSINHQLDTIEDFILNNGKDDDIFLFVGDHQPHVISSNSDGTETIAHIVSKNKDFLDGFEKYGFKENLIDTHLPVKHEALYSMFLREFNRTYGKNHNVLPNYEPNGIQL